jgi:hypothetical protein
MYGAREVPHKVLKSSGFHVATIGGWLNLPVNKKIGCLAQARASQAEQPLVSSFIIVCLRVLVRTGRWPVGARALAIPSSKVLLPS